MKTIEASRFVLKMILGNIPKKQKTMENIIQGSGIS
jgi:hypothetical protein